MKKIIPFLTLFILFGNMVSCEQVRTETNYYKPNIKEEYKEISKDEFVNKVNSNYKSEFGYKYISLKVDWDNPDAEYFYYHYRGTVKDDLSLNNEDLFIQNQVGVNPNETGKLDFYAINYISPFGRISQATKFYECPYSYDFDSGFHKGRIVFDDSFVINKIEIFQKGVTYNFRYYNFEDLPTIKGEISLEYYLDMAYAYLERDKKPYSRVDVNHKVTNGIVEAVEYYDYMADIWTKQYTYGDAEINFHSKMGKIVFREEYCYLPCGIENYLFESEPTSYTPVSGQIGEEWIKTIFRFEKTFYRRSAICLGSEYSFIEYKLKGLNELNNEIKRRKYYVNPFKIEIEYQDKEIYCEYNDRAALTYYKEIVEDATYEYRYIYS